MDDEVSTLPKQYVVPAVEQALRVLFCLADADSRYMSLLEICAAVAIHKSKAFSILETLLRFRLVRKGSDGKGYALGPGLVFLSQKCLDHLSAPRLAAPILEELAKKTGSTAVLGLIDGTKIFIAAIHESEGDFGITMRLGRVLPLSYGAHGKAIAAFFSREERRRLLEEKDLYFYGDPAKLDRARLSEELARCRERGFAEDLGEVNLGLNVEAAPVLGPAGVPRGFIEIFGLFREKAVHGFGPLVAEAGRALSRELGADV